MTADVVPPPVAESPEKAGMTSVPAPDAHMLPAVYRIEKVRRETADIFTWNLHAVEGDTDFHFSPGQFNMLYTFGAGEVPISISGDPNVHDTLTHTIRAVGPVTRIMERLDRGDTIGVRGPFGSHWPVDESSGADILIIAGGIGLAPLRPALYQVLATRRNFGKVVVLYGTRTPPDMLFRAEIEEWRSRFDLQVLVTVDRGDLDWMGSVGVVTRLIPQAQFDPGSAVAMICGPEIMMRFTVTELRDRGVPSDHIFVSLERNMKCGIGLCGHCQLGPTFLCKDGPVFRYDMASPLLAVREL